MRLTEPVAARIVSRMKRDGYPDCTSKQVWDAYHDGDVIGQESLCSRILQAFDDYGVEVPRQE
jgi:hypothetical protein